MTRNEYGAAIAAILTAEQVARIKLLHDEVAAAWDDGCAAHAESADCCIDAIVKAFTDTGS